MRGLGGLLAAAYRRRRRSPFINRHSTAGAPNPLLDLFYACGDISALRKIHAATLPRGLCGDLTTQTKLLSLYAELEDIGPARKLFDEIPDPDLYCYRVMLRAYIINERYWDAINLFDALGWSFGRARNDDVVFSIVLKACIKLRRFDDGKKLHSCVIKGGISAVFVMNSLIDMYAKSENLEMAEKVFQCIAEPSVVSWTSLMNGYITNDCAQNAMLLFTEMTISNVMRNEHTFVALLQACGALAAVHDGRWVHGAVIKGGNESAAFIGTALLDMYAKCGEITDALTVFDRLGSIDTVSWTAMVSGFLQNGDPLAALRLFADDRCTLLTPHSATIACALSAAAQLEDCNIGKAIHSIGIKFGLEEYADVVTALVDMYSKCRELVHACDVFQRAEVKDVVVWSTMIQGCVENNSASVGLRLFERMRASGCPPDAVAVVHALSACACSSDVSSCQSMHALAAKCGMLSNAYVHGALVNLYHQCADPAAAQRVFDEMHGGSVMLSDVRTCSGDIPGLAAGTAGGSGYQ